MEKHGKIKFIKATLKIAVPILITIGLVGVWFLKNSEVLLQSNNDTVTEIYEKGINQFEGIENTSLDEVNDDFSLNVTNEIDLEKLKSYGVPIIIDFGADSCIPCKEMAPVLEKLNEDLNGKAIIKFVDIWKYPDLAKNYPISVIPTQIFINNDGNPYVPSEDNVPGIIMYSTKDTNEHVFTTHEGGITEDSLLNILNEMGLEE